jgi:hypothetical protein
MKGRAGHRQLCDTVEQRREAWLWGVDGWLEQMVNEPPGERDASSMGFGEPTLGNSDDQGVGVFHMVRGNWGCHGLCRIVPIHCVPAS